MACKYPLEWLDATAATLSHLRYDPSTLSEEYLASVIEDAPKQVGRIQSSMKQEIFSLSQECQVEILVRHYHASLIALLDTALENSEAFAEGNGLLPRACSILSTVLDELLSFVEKWYHRYLSLDECVPLSQMASFRTELPQRLLHLGASLETKTGDSELATAITASLSPSDGVQRMTFRELRYRKEIIQRLEALETCGHKDCASKEVNELLAYMNFNSKAYLSYFTDSITRKTDMAQTYQEKAGVLLLELKQFNQIYRREGVRLNTYDADLKASVAEWFAHELAYLDRSRQLAANPADTEIPPYAGAKKTQKLTCSLSVDQIALLVRSADESKILVCRSVNAAFRTLVPFLSTEERDELSPDSMRSKSYAAERKDKEIVIARLEQMIAMIREY